MKATQYNNTHILAENYIAANKSDPFARNRVYSHIANGICDSGGKSGVDDCRYSAESYLETRYLPDGREYQVTAYKNIRRP